MRYSQNENDMIVKNILFLSTFSMESWQTVKKPKYKNQGVLAEKIYNIFFSQ